MNIPLHEFALMWFCVTSGIGMALIGVTIYDSFKEKIAWAGIYDT